MVVALANEAFCFLYTMRWYEAALDGKGGIRIVTIDDLKPPSVLWHEDNGKRLWENTRDMPLGAISGQQLQEAAHQLVINSFNRTVANVDNNRSTSAGTAPGRQLGEAVHQPVINSLSKSDHTGMDSNPLTVLVPVAKKSKAKLRQQARRNRAERKKNLANNTITRNNQSADQAIGQQFAPLPTHNQHVRPSHGHPSFLLQSQYPHVYIPPQQQPIVPLPEAYMARQPLVSTVGYAAQPELPISSGTYIHPRFGAGYIDYGTCPIFLPPTSQGVNIHPL
ncbi:hypothetical protein GIB67_003925 [Kingdonia uniflora]|uniref:Uncharacterized protein n=1 Tax=Kingdonia uniflora TaxID=39325 RepID=A0A7J7LK81_9MAGN|nr:hypothetical protein GIB67_003925 [Kingdonia uniflora]